MKEPEGDKLERELTGAMARVQAPVGFLDAVMEAAERDHRPSAGAVRVLAFPQRFRWIGGVAASLLLGGVLFGGVERHRVVERGRAERDFARSLEITDRAMQQTREHLQRAGVQLD